MKKIYLFLNVLFILFGCNNAKENRKIEFKKGDKLSGILNIDSIKSVEITNWHGTKNLNKSEIQSFSNDLKSYYFHQFNAPTKPGHLKCLITFKNNKKFDFYSNSESDIMFYYRNNYKNLMTFKTDKKIDFEKY